MPTFLAADNLKPFISEELRQSTTPIMFRGANGRRMLGYDAMLLPGVCEVYIKAKHAGAILPMQEHIVRACEILSCGLGRVGTIALIDEATGYQEERARDELSTILEAYIAPELMPWTRMFQPEFFKQLYRLHGWEYKPGSAKRPQCVGQMINKYIYEKLPPGVLDELKQRNPVVYEKGQRRHKHHQFLTADTGNPHLDDQVRMVTLLMRVSVNKGEFEDKFDMAFPKNPNHTQGRLPFVVKVQMDDKLKERLESDGEESAAD